MPTFTVSPQHAGLSGSVTHHTPHFQIVPIDKILFLVSMVQQKSRLMLEHTSLSSKEGVTHRSSRSVGGWGQDGIYMADFLNDSNAHLVLLAMPSEGLSTAFGAPQSTARA
jgi:hypothetical protein